MSPLLSLLLLLLLPLLLLGRLATSVRLEAGRLVEPLSAASTPSPEFIRPAGNWDREHSNYPPDLEVDGRSRQFLNVSIFKILQHGCFDHDVTRFCGNRITRFSCLYWIDTHAGDKTNSFKGGAKVEENLKKIGLDAEFFESMEISEVFGLIKVQQPSAPIPHQLGNALFNTTVHELTPEIKHKLHHDEEQKLPDCALYRGRADLPRSWRLFLVCSLPVLILFSAGGNFIAALILAKMGRNSLSICYFSSTVSALDGVFTLISAGDLWLRSLAHIDITFMLLFACETCCQVYPMVFSFAMHLRQLCLVAIAIDTVMLYTKLDHFYPKYDRERVFNCYVLFFALLISLNCQFLWTYSLSRLDSPGETNRGYHCGFSDKWVEVRYKALVWPLIDFAVGDFIPILVSVYCLIVVLHLHIRGRGTWVNRENVHNVVFDAEAFQQIRLASMLTVALELPFSFPGVAFNFFRFLGSASHMVQEHIFSSQSLRSLLVTRSHGTILERKMKYDLYFNVDMVSQLLMLSWFCARPVLHFWCQAPFRRCLGESLGRVRRSLMSGSGGRHRRRSESRRCRRSDTRLTPVELECQTVPTLERQSEAPCLTRYV